MTARRPRTPAPRAATTSPSRVPITHAGVAALAAELALPAACDREQPWQQVLWLALPRLAPVRLWRQVPGKHKVERGGVMRGAPAGAADLTGAVVGTGRRVELEVKFDGAALRPAQLRWLAERAADGCVTLVVDYDPRGGVVENLLAAAGQLAAALLAPPAGGEGATR